MDERMGWDDQMSNLRTIDQVHIQSGDRWRGWDDQMSDLHIFSENNWPSSHTFWRRMKRMGWDDQMSDLKKN